MKMKMKIASLLISDAGQLIICGQAPIALPKRKTILMVWIQLGTISPWTQVKKRLRCSQNCMEVTFTFLEEVTSWCRSKWKRTANSSISFLNPLQRLNQRCFTKEVLSSARVHPWKIVELAVDANGLTSKTASISKKFKSETRTSRLGEMRMLLRWMSKLSKSSKSKSLSKYFKLELRAR